MDISLTGCGRKGAEPMRTSLGEHAFTKMFKDQQEEEQPSGKSVLYVNQSIRKSLNSKIT